MPFDLMALTIKACFFTFQYDSVNVSMVFRTQGSFFALSLVTQMSVCAEVQNLTLQTLVCEDSEHCPCLWFQRLLSDR